MATSYIENKNGTYDASRGKTFGAHWFSQSFTVPRRFVVKQVTLKLARTGSPGNTTLSIRESSEHIPTTEDMCNAIIPQASIVADVTGAEVTATMLVPVVLYPGVIYTMVLRSPSGDSSNFVVWCTTADNTYTKGKMTNSDDSGVNWDPFYGGELYDGYFDVLGDFQLILIGEDFFGKKYGQHVMKRISWNTDVVQYRSNLDQANQIWSNPVRFWNLPYRHITSAQRSKFEELVNRTHGSFNPLAYTDPDDYTATCEFTQAALLITGLSQTNHTFTVDGKYDDKFFFGWTMKIFGSTGNDGVFTVVSVSYDSVEDETTIEVEDDILSVTVDGSIYQLEFPLSKTYYPTELEQYIEYKHCIQPGTIAVTVDSVAKTECTDYYLDDLVGRLIFVSTACPADGAVIAASFDFYFKVRLDSDTHEDTRLSNIIWVQDNLNFHEVKCNHSFEKLSPEVGGSPPEA